MTENTLTSLLLIHGRQDDYVIPEHAERYAIDFVWDFDNPWSANIAWRH